MISSSWVLTLPNVLAEDQGQYLVYCHVAAGALEQGQAGGQWAADAAVTQLWIRPHALTSLDAALYPYKQCPPLFPSLHKRN